MRRVFIALAAVLLVTSAAAAGVAAGEKADRGEVVTLTVSVLDRNDDPVGGATLTATWDGGSSTATTASNGKAFLDVEGGTDVTITIDHPNYVRNSPYVVEDATERDIEIHVARKGSATIRVFDADGTPVEGAKVALFDRDGNEVVGGDTDGNGRFTTGVIERGQYNVRAFKTGYKKNWTALSVTGDVEHKMAIERGSVTLTIVVSDDHFNPPKPVQDARVTVGESTVTTLSNGEATVQVPVNSRIGVTVTKEGYEEVKQQLNVFEKPKEIEATIQRTPKLNIEASNQRIVVGEQVRLDVTNEYGQPVEDAAVLLDGEQVGTTNAEGVARVTIESKGTHQLRVESDSLSGEVAVEGVQPAGSPTPTPEPTPTPTSAATPTPGLIEDLKGVAGPGFTPAAAVLAIALVLLALRRRR